jgi:hypothetical protein
MLFGKVMLQYIVNKVVLQLKRWIPRRTVDLMQVLDYGLDGHGLIPGTAEFFLRHNVQTGSGAHPASYTVGTGMHSFGGKPAGA